MLVIGLLGIISSRKPAQRLFIVRVVRGDTGSTSHFAYGHTGRCNFGIPMPGFTSKRMEGWRGDRLGRCRNSQAFRVFDLIVTDGNGIHDDREDSEEITTTQSWVSEQ